MVNVSVLRLQSYALPVVRLLYNSVRVLHNSEKWLLMRAKYDYEVNYVMLRGDFCMCTYQNMGAM